MDVRKSQCLDSTEEAGERSPCGPRGGKRGIESMELLLGDTTNAWKFDKRIHETATDSRVGETLAVDGIHFPGLSDGH
jgi:hypothetical protein